MDIFALPEQVYYWPKNDNFLIYKPGDIFMLGCIYGSTLRKMMVGPVENAHCYAELIYVGDL